MGKFYGNVENPLQTSKSNIQNTLKQVTKLKLSLLLECLFVLMLMMCANLLDVWLLWTPTLLSCLVVFWKLSKYKNKRVTEKAVTSDQMPQEPRSDRKLSWWCFFSGSFVPDFSDLVSVGYFVPTLPCLTVF